MAIWPGAWLRLRACSATVMGKCARKRRSRPSRVCLRPATAWVGASRFSTHLPSTECLSASLRHPATWWASIWAESRAHLASRLLPFPAFPFSSRRPSPPDGGSLARSAFFQLPVEWLAGSFPSLCLLHLRGSLASAFVTLRTCRGEGVSSDFDVSAESGRRDLLASPRGKLLISVPRSGEGRRKARPLDGGRGFRSARSGEVRLEDWRT